MVLNKDQIMSADDLPFKDVDIPEWGGSVRVRTMTGSERDSFEAAIYTMNGDKVKLNREDFRAKLLARVIINEKGDRLFSDGELKLLGSKSAKALQKLFDVAQELNGISKESADTLLKNSESGDGISLSSPSLDA